MLEGNTEIRKNFKNLHAEPGFLVHHVLFDTDNGKALLPRDAGDDIVRAVFVRGGHYHRADIRGAVRVADVYGYARKLHGEYAFLMQHRRAHVGKLAQLAVGDYLDRVRIFDNARIAHQEPGNVRPVFVYIRHHGTGDYRPGDIAPPAGKRFDAPVRHTAVKPGNNGVFRAGKAFGHDTVGTARIKASVGIEEYHLRRIKEIITDIFGKNKRIEVFPAGSDIIAGRTLRKALLYRRIFRRKIRRKAKPVYDIIVPRHYIGKFARKILPRRSPVIAGKQEIGHLCILREAFARRAGDDKPARGFAFDNIRAFSELFGRGERASAEFYHFFLVKVFHDDSSVSA